LAARLVRHGVLERVVAGGGDVCVLRAFVEDLTDAYIVHGEDLHRPFSLLKNKRVLGDACGAVVLEGLAAARRRGARPLAELSGFGSFSGGAGLEFPEAEPYARAIRAALADAALEPADVTCAMAHAGATRFGDLVEARSLFDALYEGGRNPVPVTAITPNFGYTCGATGVLEAVVAIQMIARGAVPPILGLRKARNKYVDRMNLASRAIRGPVRSVITCSYGVGGTYASLAFSEAPRG
jgi:3-oxoacyl-(acyl-carrier-protein) synthase